MRSEYCGWVTSRQLQQTVTVFGWVHRRRDHGSEDEIAAHEEEVVAEVREESRETVSLIVSVIVFGSFARRAGVVLAGFGLTGFGGGGVVALFGVGGAGGHGGVADGGDGGEGD